MCIFKRVVVVNLSHLFGIGDKVSFKHNVTENCITHQAIILGVIDKIIIYDKCVEYGIHHASNYYYVNELDIIKRCK